VSAADAFCKWLAATPLSQTIAKVGWIIPAVQTVHILAVASVLTAVLMIDRRMLQTGAREPSMAWVARRFLPFIWWPLPVLLVTGSTLIIGEPDRTLKNPEFFLKMGLLLAAVLVTLACQLPLRRDPDFWHQRTARRWAARLLAVASLLLFAGIAIAGRWIAYTQST
jgi:uncharacterized membrane protein